MLPTPSTSHINPNRIYPPSEDSYLLLDTLSSPSEIRFLHDRFSSTSSSSSSSHPPNSPSLPSPSSPTSPTPLILEVGTGSGLILAFVTAHSRHILGRADVLSLGTDVNLHACVAAAETVRRACAGLARGCLGAQGGRERERDEGKGNREGDGEGDGDGERREGEGRGREKGCPPLLALLTADLTTPLRTASVDILIFNPPYVPTSSLPSLPTPFSHSTPSSSSFLPPSSDAHLLELSYAGGIHGTQVLNRLLAQLPTVLDPVRGVAYVLLCASNGPAEVVGRVRTWGEKGGEWGAEVVGGLGKRGGWERLVVVRIWKV